MQMASKYRNKKITFQGLKFDSKLELQRWLYLSALQQQGKIFNLQRQVKYTLIPRQIDSVTRKTIEREIAYIADFVYSVASERKTETIIEDAKGIKTDVYKMKRKMMLYFHNIRIHEVTSNPNSWKIRGD